MSLKKKLKSFLILTILLLINSNCAPKITKTPYILLEKPNPYPSSIQKPLRIDSQDNEGMFCFFEQDLLQIRLKIEELNLYIDYLESIIENEY